MPAPLRVDWDIALQLFLGGLSLNAVAVQRNIPLTALRKRCTRYGWNQLALKQSQKVSERISRAVQSVQVNDAKALIDQSNAWKHRIIKLTDRHIAAIEAKDPETLKLQDFETLARITDTTDRVARRSFGLDVAQVHTSNVLVQVQGEASLVKQLPAGDDKVIDVESVQTQDTKQDKPS